MILLKSVHVCIRVSKLYTYTFFILSFSFIFTAFALFHYFFFKLQKREGGSTPTTPTTASESVNACKTRFGLCLTISLLALSHAVKSDAGRNNIVSTLELLHHSKVFDNIRFYQM